MGSKPAKPASTPPANTNSTSNSTANSNSTSNSTGNNNSTSNSTANSNSTSTSNNTTIGNSTMNGTVNGNSTSNSTTNGGNSTSAINGKRNSSLSFEKLIQLFPILEYSKGYQHFINGTMAAISVPGARKIISPIFYYFSNFDDLSLYSWHFRPYGDTLNYLFTQVSQVEEAKWSMVNYSTVLEKVGGNKEEIDKLLFYQNDYFIESSRGVQGMMGNYANFFFFYVPIIILAFIFLRIVFRFLFNFKISKMLRRFDFWGYFLIVLFEGNIQMFTFSLMAEFRHCFAFTPTTKMLKFFLIVFGLVVTLLSFGGYLIGKIIYRKLNSYFLQNQFNSLCGNTAVLLQNGIRNFILGCIHYWLRFYSYYTLIGFLLVVEMGCNIFVIRALSSNMFYTGKSRVWLYLLLNFFRFSIILTLSEDYRNPNTFQAQLMQTFLVLAMVFIYIFCIGFGLISMFLQLKDYVCKSARMKSLQRKRRNAKIQSGSRFLSLNNKKDRPNIQLSLPRSARLKRKCIYKIIYTQS